MIVKKFEEILEKAKTMSSKEEAIELISSLKNDLKKQDEDLESSESCLIMIKELLDKKGMKMDNCPPMFYPEAISNLILKSLQEVGAIPNHEAKFKWTETSPGNYKKIEITNEQQEKGN